MKRKDGLVKALIIKRGNECLLFRRCIAMERVNSILMPGYQLARKVCIAGRL